MIFVLSASGTQVEFKKFITMPTSSLYLLTFLSFKLTKFVQEWLYFKMKT